MEIKLPQNGCNVFYGSYVDNYNNNTRTRYYVFDGELIKNNEQTYNYNPVPSGANCISSLTYGSELSIYFEFISIVIIGFAFWLLYRTIIKRLLP